MSASRAALASVATAGLLLVLKGGAAAATGSVAMLGSLADSALDLVASLVTLWGVRVAARPADRDHRFGHGKAEALAALFQAALIVVSAVAIAWAAAKRLLVAAPTAHAEAGIGVSLVAITATLALVSYQRRVLAATGSLAIRADHLHYQSDLLLNVAVIAALALESYAGVRGVDPLFGVGIAGWLLWGAWRASRRAVDELMDREWPEERREAFLMAARAHPALGDVHDLRTRTSGDHDFAQFHVNVAPGMTVAQAHRVMDEVEATLRGRFPDVEVLIHTDPEPDPPA